MKKRKHIEIFPYNPIWPQTFEEEAANIKNILNVHCLAVHHIGSTSIPGLYGKQDIDIICVIDCLDESLALEKIGYTFKGELNIPLRYYFSKNTSKIKVNLHVVGSDHAFVNLNLYFRNYLRSHKQARIEYRKLKEELLKHPSSYEKFDNAFTGYNLGKNEFIKSILNKASYNDLSVNFCMHDREWEEYHRIREEQIFKRTHRKYDRNHPTLSDPKHYHFVLYRGVVIIGVAHIEFLSDVECALRPFAIDTPFQRMKYGLRFLTIIEKWLRQQGQIVIHLHAYSPTHPFYEKLGYQRMPFNDYKPGLSTESIDMGKRLDV
ncbi:MAG: bifunctional GrpB family protein/GNAT family N-acetyltransferase [Chlamydiales bacterium]